MQIKPTVRYHFTPTRMAIIKFSINKCWPGCGETATLVPCWWEYTMVQLLWKTFWEFLKKLNIELPYDPAILLIGIYPKELKAGIQTDICTPVFKAALLTLAKRWKEPKCLDKTNMLCVGIIQPLKRMKF